MLYNCVSPILIYTRVTGIERDLIPEHSVKEISQATKIKDLYFDLLKSSKKEIMLIFPSNKAFERQERMGIIGLIKQVAREKNLKVRRLVPAENLETSQGSRCSKFSTCYVYCCGHHCRN